MFDYEIYIKDKIAYVVNYLKSQNKISNEYNIEIANEQYFVNKRTYNPNYAYAVIKYLSSSITFNTKTQPVQITILCEDNSMEDTKLVFNEFTNTYNWKVEKQNNTYIKQTYNSPVVMSNFGEDMWGYKTLLYVSATLFIMDQVLDLLVVDNGVKNYGKIKIDNVNYDYINATINYQMTPNTQQLASEKLASSVRSLSTLGLTLIIPFYNNALTNKIMNISLGQGNNNGNADFAFVFSFDTTTSGSYITYNGNMKLISCSVSSSSNDVPSISVSFMR